MPSSQDDLDKLKRDIMDLALDGHDVKDQIAIHEAASRELARQQAEQQSGSE